MLSAIFCFVVGTGRAAFSRDAASFSSRALFSVVSHGSRRRDFGRRGIGAYNAEELKPCLGGTGPLGGGRAGILPLRIRQSKVTSNRKDMKMTYNSKMNEIK